MRLGVQRAQYEDQDLGWKLFEGVELQKLMVQDLLLLLQPSKSLVLRVGASDQCDTLAIDCQCGILLLQSAQGLSQAEIAPRVSR